MHLPLNIQCGSGLEVLGVVQGVVLGNALDVALVELVGSKYSPNRLHVVSKWSASAM